MASIWEQMNEPQHGDTQPLPRQDDMPGPYLGPRPAEPGRAGEAHGRPGRRGRRKPWGSLPPGRGVWIVIGVTALGAIATITAGREPGPLLGGFVIAGTIIAGFAVRPRAAYAIIPVPALSYAVAIAITGLVHDRAADTSRSVLAVNALQWIASGFWAMAVATALAIIIFLGRWQWNRHVAHGSGHARHAQAGQPSESHNDARVRPPEQEKDARTELQLLTSAGGPHLRGR